MLPAQTFRRSTRNSPLITVSCRNLSAQNRALEGGAPHGAHRWGSKMSPEGMAPEPVIHWGGGGHTQFPPGCLQQRCPGEDGEGGRSSPWKILSSQRMEPFRTRLQEHPPAPSLLRAQLEEHVRPCKGNRSPPSRYNKGAQRCGALQPPSRFPFPDISASFPFLAAQLAHVFLHRP